MAEWCEQRATRRNASETITVLAPSFRCWPNTHARLLSEQTAGRYKCYLCLTSYHYNTPTSLNTDSLLALRAGIYEREPAASTAHCNERIHLRNINWALSSGAYTYKNAFHSTPASKPFFLFYQICNITEIQLADLFQDLKQVELKSYKYVGVVANLWL